MGDRGGTQRRRRTGGAIRRLLGRLSADRPLAALVVLVVASLPLVTPYLRGDGNGYYAWLRSPVIDGDLDFADEFARGDPAFLRATGWDGERFNADLYTDGGLIRNQWGVGAAVAWAPAFLAAHAVVSAADAVGVGRWPPDGFSLPYRWATGAATALWAGAGVVASFAVARRLVAPGAALAGTLVAWWASSLPVYQWFLPFWPFGVGAGMAGLLVWVLHGTPEMSGRRWLGAGVLCGLLVAVHPVGVARTVAPAVRWLTGPRRWPERLGAAWRFGAGAILGVAPQLVAKALVHGSPLDTGYRVEFDFRRPHFWRTLVGADHDLWSWTPVTLVGVAGLVVLARTDRRLAGAVLGVFATMVLIVAAYQTYEQSSYGNRFFVLFTPGFVIGTAVVAGRLWDRRRAVAAAAGAALMVWNGLFMFQWAWGMIPKRGPVDWGDMARQQVTEAPAELVRAVRLFVTDRGEFIATVQGADEATLTGES